MNGLKEIEEQQSMILLERVTIKMMNLRFFFLSLCGVLRFHITFFSHSSALKRMTNLHLCYFHLKIREKKIS